MPEPLPWLGADDTTGRGSGWKMRDEVSIKESNSSCRQAQSEIVALEKVRQMLSMAVCQAVSFLCFNNQVGNKRERNVKTCE